MDLKGFPPLTNRGGKYQTGKQSYFLQSQCWRGFRAFFVAFWVTNWCTCHFLQGNRMVTRRRLNLSLAESDFLALCDVAKHQGKLPSTFAADLLKSVLHQELSGVLKRLKVQRFLAGPDLIEPPSVSPARIPTPAVAPLNRDQRRAAQHKKQKGKR